MRRLLGSDDNRLLVRFLGRRFVLFSALSFSAATLGGVVDYLFAVVIQLFLVTMGLGAGIAPAIHVPALQQPLVVGGLLVSLGALRGVFLFLQGFGAGIAQEHASSRIRQSAILSILPRDDNSPRVTVAEAIFTYSELSGKAAVYLQNLIKLFAAALQTLILGAAMLYLSWLDCLIAAGLLLFAGIVLLRINVHIGHVAKSNPRIWSESAAAIESAGRNWFYIRIKHLHGPERDRLDALNRDVTAIGFRLRRLSEISPAAVNVLAVVILAVLTNTRALVTHTPATIFLSFLYVFLRFAQALGECARDASGLIEFRPYLERLRTVLLALPIDERALPQSANRLISPWSARPVEATSSAARPRTSLPRPAALGSPTVTLADVSFRYDGDGPWILRELDIDIAPGSQLAIVGPSGCGKSTLLAIILGFLRPTTGQVAIGGVPPERFCADFAEYIGYVGPEPYIVTGSVRDNLLFGSNGAYSDEDLWQALRLAAVDDVVRALPRQLDTPLRHHDVELSMGQRQRIALARALLPRPVLLILDEASANLDDATEETIATSIRSLHGTTTMVIVSHKLGLVRHADKVVDLARAREGRTRDSRTAP